ncbi:MAG TPA: cobalamin-binding protein [Polyangia bacterium]
MRVVSLIASATEIVCALGCEPLLVGRSHECDFPPSVTKLPVLTEPKFMVEGTSSEIDARVKEILRHALSVYRVDPEKLAEARPDVIVTQAHCEVCAVSVKDVELAVCQALPSRPKIVALEPNGLDDVWRDIGKVASALEVPERGAALVSKLMGKMAQIAERAHAEPHAPTVALIEWIDPLMSAGNWMPTLCELAGAVPLFGEAGKHSPWMTWDELRARDPEVIVVMPCGFDLARTRQELLHLTSRPDWRELRAVKTGRAFYADGNQYFNRPGPRLVESLEILAELFHPGVFDFGHRGEGWAAID